MVSYSDIDDSAGDSTLAKYVADRAPLFYRAPSDILSTIKDGYLLTAMREALIRLPTSDHFQDSHFAEILSADFAENILGWRLLYSKLTLLTTQNANSNKMDLIFYVPESDPPTFVMGEVKSSVKSESPANHHRSCYPALFSSLGNYSTDDLEFDLTAAKGRVSSLPSNERRIVKTALLPYQDRRILYAGFVVIDTSTRADSETSMLASRKSEKDFDIDLVCVEQMGSVAETAYSILEALRQDV